MLVKLLNKLLSMAKSVADISVKLLSKLLSSIERVAATDK